MAHARPPSAQEAWIFVAGALLVLCLLYTCCQRCRRPKAVQGRRVGMPGGTQLHDSPPPPNGVPADLSPPQLQPYEMRAVGGAPHGSPIAAAHHQPDPRIVQAIAAGDPTVLAAYYSNGPPPATAPQYPNS